MKEIFVRVSVDHFQIRGVVVLVGSISHTFCINAFQSFFERALIGDGYLKPVIDRIYPLEQIVEANEYVDIGHKKRKRCSQSYSRLSKHLFLFSNLSFNSSALFLPPK